MLLSTAPSRPVSGSGSQPGQYTGALIRLASFCQAPGSLHAGFGAGGAALATFAESPPQPVSTTESPTSRHNARSPLTGAMVARRIANRARGSDVERPVA